jgi:ABC-type multidrug transport system fused ATPase/permease subunit
MVYHGIYVDVVRAFLEWVSFVGILGLSVYLILQARDFEQLLPRLTLYSMASYRVIPAIHELFGLWSRVEYDRKYLEEIEELLAGPTIEERGPQKPVDLSDSVGLVRLRHVDFFYEGCERQILHDISMEVRRCEWIGIVGTTGAGKSTLLDLLSGLCRPSSGTVTVGRTPLDPECIADWQRRIAVVPQEVILLDDTLLRNVAFGVPDAEIDPARVERVCQDAGLADYLERLPEGYQTRLGERGVRLSGGERQRVGLARALYLQPELLLLDEATSALDQATEGRIVATLRELASACTLITVAHRLTSVKPCDRILVLEQGRIVDQGPYQELLERSPAFRELALLGQSC